MRVRRLPTLALAVLALALPAGCARSADDAPAAPAPVPATASAATAEGETATAAPAALPDACGLVTAAEAEKLAGTPLDDAVPVRDTCSYTAPVDGPTAQVEVYVGDGAEKYLGIERDLGHEVRPLSGVGDEAHLTAEAFFVRKARVWVAVRLVRLNDPEENRAPLEGLARVVADRF
ncbi:hypothetical protein GA0070606_0227 [Micromonospora citrea]|uniref:DUF3558 domain-containing protein n=1 Tax=Micromonospora citrea TaxID=47855 RepID=A0A1C6TR72_9ACTN|nr:hypothetical protein [Micromonospora citrea]SCL44302.1 hypothetical protein GA0070606_0227 [Micromonospora citrea]